MPQPNSLAKPIIAATVEPSTEDTREKMDLALAKIVQEDPFLRVHINSKSRQTILSGISEQHLEIVADLLMREHGVAVNLGNPEVIYLETIRSMAVAEGKYIRQLGGKGNYGHVKIRLQPNEYGKGYEFSNDTRDGLVPAEYIPAIDHGLQEAMQHGVLSGSEMVDIEVSLYDGSYHEIDSNEMAFKIAAATAFKEAARKAMPVLLEPVMCVQVTVPEEYMGAIINDLNSRRGRIEDMQMLNSLQIISATAPLNTILGYPAKIRSLSYGRANCSITFKTYEVAPYPPEDDWQAPVRMKQMSSTLIQIVDAALASATQRSGPHLACRPGCFQCCIGVFPISQQDAHRLREALQSLEQTDPEKSHRIQTRATASRTRFNPHFPGDPLTGILNEDYESSPLFTDESEDSIGDNEPCPVLDPTTGTCDLYEARPIVCRTFGPPMRTAEDNLATCELCFTHATTEEIAACELDPTIPAHEAACNEAFNAAHNLHGQTIIAYALRQL